MPGVPHYEIYAFPFNVDEATGDFTSTRLTDAVVQKTKQMAAYAPMMNGFVWLMGRTATDAPGCPCPAGYRRKLLFGSMGKPAPEAAASTCCVSF